MDAADAMPHDPEAGEDGGPPWQWFIVRAAVEHAEDEEVGIWAEAALSALGYVAPMEEEHGLFGAGLDALSGGVTAGGLEAMRERALTTVGGGGNA